MAVIVRCIVAFDLPIIILSILFMIKIWNHLRSIAISSLYGGYEFLLSFSSLIYGVSKILGTLSNSGKWTILCNVSKPIQPLPIFSCLSLPAPSSFLLSFIWNTAIWSVPIILSNYSKVALKSFTKSYPLSFTWHVSKHTLNLSLYFTPS